jgi:anti-sigma factor RsiW
MKPDARSRCRGLLERLSRYVDGDLTARERRTVMAHLHRCPCCEQFAASLRRTVQACHEAGRRRLPSDVRARAQARIQALLAEKQRVEDIRLKRGTTSC